MYTDVAQFLAAVESSGQSVAAAIKDALAAALRGGTVELPVEEEPSEEITLDFDPNDFLF